VPIIRALVTTLDRRQIGHIFQQLEDMDNARRRTMGEALANAFVHRDYAIAGGAVSVALFDDLLEVISSGDLHFGLTPEAIFWQHEGKNDGENAPESAPENA